MSGKPNFNKLKKKATLTGRYEKQLERLKAEGIDPSCVEAAVNGTVKKLAASAATSMVIYGDPQSGKTEMMICLTAKLLDSGHHIIIHLLNDSVDLLTQNLKRFKKSGLAPVAQISSEILPKTPKAKKSSAPKIAIPSELVLICKKNTKDLQVLTNWLQHAQNVVVIDDEADYATPNSKVNKGTKSKINDWVAQLKGAKGRYIGVTATPARLDLNNTFGNETDKWVKFPPHSQYTGQDTFFPLDPKDIKFRLVLLQQGASQKEARNALLRFLVTVAQRNTVGPERYYTMLVHTSGKRDDHEVDRATIEKAVTILRESAHPEFETLAGDVYSTAEALYPESDPQALAEYVVENASKTALIVLNSKHSRQASMGSATEPISPFTIIIGGNIVSRGVTFPNLLAMFFTRDVKTKLQQDTYIQRARMFGARGDLLPDFELTIPGPLYDDWKKCFIYHKLALATIESNVDVPTWAGDKRVSVVSSSSIDKSTVTLEKGEMSFGMFDFSPELDEIVGAGSTKIEVLQKLKSKIGDEAFPEFLVSFIKSALKTAPKSLAVHKSSSIAGYKMASVKAEIKRKKGFMGSTQLEAAKFPNAEHHVRIFRNEQGRARVFYKYQGISFAKNTKGEQD